MRIRSLVPYIITALVTTVAAFFVIPWFDTLRWPGTTYAEGFNILNAFIAVCCGCGLAFTLYRGDRKTEKQNAEADRTEGQDPSL